MAHVLAASGFHVSILLGVVLAIAKKIKLKSKPQLIIGIVTLIIYVSLTGLQPSVLRASLMGIASLIWLVRDENTNTQNKIKPIDTLLIIATLLLIFNPRWIGDLGFQLSFLATLGLLVTMPPLVKKLDFLPTTIASVVAIPISAMIWTSAIAIYNFKVFPTYSILVNIITTPLILIISIGGFISAGISLIFPTLGEFIAWLISFPLNLLMRIIEYFNSLPYSQLELSLNLIVVTIIYIIFFLIYFLKLTQKKKKQI